MYTHVTYIIDFEEKNKNELLIIQRKNKFLRLSRIFVEHLNISLLKKNLDSISLLFFNQSKSKFHLYSKK